MTSKIIRIIIKIIAIALIFIMINIPVAKATSYWDEIIQQGKDFVEDGKKEENDNPTINKGEFSTLNGKIYNALLALGVVLAVIIGGILGIQLMWGSVEQQVKAKEMLIPYAIGCVVIFGAFGIWKICVTVFSQL